MRAVKITLCVLLVLFLCGLALGFTSLKLFYSKADYLKQCENYKPEWFLCKNDTDCEVVGLCKPLGAINKKYAEEVSVCNKDMLSVLDCATFSSKYRDEMPKCHSGSCVLQKD